MKAPGGTMFGTPKGVFVVAVTEFWERYSYYGMVSILVLFLSTDVAGGGFGWSKPASLQLFGIYSACAFIAPVLGGWISARFLGDQRSIIIGGLVLAAGHAMLASPMFLPLIYRAQTSCDLDQALTALGVPLGTMIWSHHLGSAGGRCAGKALILAATYHRLISAGFFLALSTIIAGTALIKPAVTSIIGRFYDPHEARECEAAFTLFQVILISGVVLSYATVGLTGERLGWHFGFGLAGLGMMIGITIFLFARHRYVGDVGAIALARLTSRSTEKLERAERDKVKAVLIFLGFGIVYATPIYLKAGLLNLFTRDHIDRSIGGFEIPVTWFLLINSLTFILVSPAFAWLWRRMEQHGRTPDAILKLIYALIFVAAGFLFLVGAALQVGAAPSGHASLAWMIGLYLCIGLADGVSVPSQLAFVNRMAPDRYKTLFAGLYYSMFGISALASGYIGAFAFTIGFLATFVAITLACVLAAIALFGLRARLLRLAGPSR